MAWSLEDLRVLDAAIATGARRVKYADREVEYRTLDDMLRVRDALRATMADSTPRAEVFNPIFDKGLSYGPKGST